jgi:hypothetical protein
MQNRLRSLWLLPYFLVLSPHMAYTIFLAINKKRPTHFEQRIRRLLSLLRIFCPELFSTKNL